LPKAVSECASGKEALSDLKRQEFGLKIKNKQIGTLLKGLKRYGLLEPEKRLRNAFITLPTCFPVTRRVQ
jgi:hypothetical protein